MNQRQCSERKRSNNNVTVLNRYISLEDNKLSLRLNINNYTKQSEVILPRNEVLTVSNKLFDYGAVITTQKEFRDYIMNQEINIPLENIHSTLGWGDFSCSKFYKANSGIGCETSYFGKYDIEPKGTFDGWRETILKYAMGEIALQLAIVLGLSAVTCGYLREELDSSMLTHIYGESSKGKTTFAMLALSTSSNPNPVCKNTMFCDWGDTPNYLIASLANNYGFPVVFDELSKSRSKDLTEFCYNITNTKGKGRLNSNAEVKEVDTWCTSIISTGESSLLAKCNNNGGLLARVIELSPNKITSSAKQAEQLKIGICKNYGYANLELAKYILKYPQKPNDLYHEWRQTFHTSISMESQLIQRLSKKLSVIMATAQMCQEALNLDFDIESLKNMLIDSVISQNEFTPYEQTELLTNYLLTDITTNPSNYEKLANNGICAAYGRNITGFIKNLPTPIQINDESCEAEILYPTEKFEQFLQRGGFTNVRKELTLLANKGYLQRDGHHFSIRRKIGGKSIKVYVVRFPISLFNTDKNEGGYVYEY